MWVKAYCWALVAVAVMAGSRIVPAEPEQTFSCKALRHGHAFLVWNEQNGPPRIVLTSVLFGKYTNGLEYQVISAEGKPLTSGELDPGGKTEVADLPVSPRYLVMAEPGYNGVVLSVDRPYGMVARRTRSLQPNAPTGFLYFYVPPECKKFDLVVCCRSPREGARVVVHRPDGSAAGTLDGDLDEETALSVNVPAGTGDAVWSVEFLPPTAPNTFLDDVVVFLDGQLPPVLCPQRDWAQKIAKEAWRIDKALKSQNR